MKTVAIVPIKLNSKRVKGKNFKIVLGKPLYQYLLDKIKRCNFDEIYIDSDSNEIKRYCLKKGFNFIKRLPKLAKDNANGNDLINYHGQIIEADLYFQLFITSPLLSVKTINRCISILKKNKNFDSILTVKEIYTWFWFNKKPVNYNPKILPRSQDAKPITMETTGLYGIRKKTLKSMKCRIGKKPYFLKVEDEETIDLDNHSDFKYLEYRLKNK